MPSRFKDLCLDASDHQALADWWCAALGYVLRQTAPVTVTVLRKRRSP